MDPVPDLRPGDELTEPETGLTGVVTDISERGAVGVGWLRGGMFETRIVYGHMEYWKSLIRLGKLRHRS